MKIGFNEATALKCEGQSLMADLEMCEKYGFDYFEIRYDCIAKYIQEGHTLEELGNGLRTITSNHGLTIRWNSLTSWIHSRLWPWTGTLTGSRKYVTRSE